MTGPSVSTVIPVYNGEAFLADAIRSVLEQTRPPAECIVVDDGSTDGSADVARSFGPDVRLVQRPNGGVAAARNRGIAEAVGEWIAFLDADDVWLPEKLARQLELVEQRPEVGLVYTGVRVVDRDLAPVADLPAPSPSVALRNSLLLEVPTMSIPSTAIVSAAALAAVGGFDERLSTSADTDLGCRLCLAGAVDAIEEPLVLYRLHDNQMHSNVAAMEHDMLLVLEKAFSSPLLPTELRPLRRRATANLWATISATELARGDRGRAASHAARAVASDPVRAAQLAGTRLRRLVRRG